MLFDSQEHKDWLQEQLKLHQEPKHKKRRDGEWGMTESDTVETALWNFPNDVWSVGPLKRLRCVQYQTDTFYGGGRRRVLIFFFLMLRRNKFNFNLCDSTWVFFNTHLSGIQKDPLIIFFFLGLLEYSFISKEQQKKTQGTKSWGTDYFCNMHSSSLTHPWNTELLEMKTWNGNP